MTELWPGDVHCRECAAPTLTKRGCPSCNLRAIAAGLRRQAEELEWEASHLIVAACRDAAAARSLKAVDGA